MTIINEESKSTPIIWDSETIQKLKDLYVDFGVTSDTLAMDRGKKTEFAFRFSLLVTCDPPTGEELVGKIIELRKKIHLPRLTNRKVQGNLV